MAAKRGEDAGFADPVPHNMPLFAIIMMAIRFASWGVAAICRGCCLSARPTRYNKALRVPRGLPAELPDSPLRN